MDFVGISTFYAKESRFAGDLISCVARAFFASASLS